MDHIFTSKLITKSNFYIVAVPTPVNKNNVPDLDNLKDSCILISKVLKKNDIVFFESTVYPGVTENFCARLLEKKSKLKSNKDFFIGYSPERINPGDKNHSIDKIYKIVSIKKPFAMSIAKRVYKKITKVSYYPRYKRSRKR